MEELLKQFNFSEGEIIVYNALLKSGGDKVSNISKATDIKRTSCQEYVRSLQQKGFINSGKIGNRFFYQAEDPDRFRQIVNERQFILSDVVRILKDRVQNKDWKVRMIEKYEANTIVKKLEKKNKVIKTHEGNTAGFVISNNNTIILYSSDKYIPALEIESQELIQFHIDLLKREV